ncbi:MAG: MYXO-CTERM sorting domain-containing protein [Myxococcota bacterium]
MILVSALGCVWSDTGALTMTDVGMSTLGSGFEHAPILAGSQTCPTIANFGSLDAGDCFDVTSYNLTSGSVTPGGCLNFEAPGEAAFDYAPNGACPWYGDRFTFQVVAGSEVRGSLWMIEDSPGLLNEHGEPLNAPAPSDGVFRIVEGSPYGLFLGLTDLGGAEVGYSYRDLGADLEQLVGDPPTLSMGTNRIDVRYRSGEVGSAGLIATLHDERWPIASVASAALSEVDSMELVLAYYRDPFDLQGPLLTPALKPAGARAVVRDGSGDLLFGAPVQWYVTQGPLAKLTHGLPGQDYIALLDACSPPAAGEGSREAEVVAVLGGLRATATFRWTNGGSNLLWTGEPDQACEGGEVPPPADTAEEPDPDEEPGGDPEPGSEWQLVGLEGGTCSCRSGPAPGGALLVAALVARRRRRARSRASGAKGWNPAPRRSRLTCQSLGGADVGRAARSAGPAARCRGAGGDRSPARGVRRG